MPGPARILLSAGLALALAGCDGLGGSADSIVAPPPTFTIVSRSPGAGREGVPLTAAIVVTFSENVDPATVEQGVISANGLTYGTLEVSGNTLKFAPVGGWVPGTAYGIALSPHLAGVSHVALGPVPVWGFKTTGTPPVHDTVLVARERPR